MTAALSLAGEPAAASGGSSIPGTTLSGMACAGGGACFALAANVNSGALELVPVTAAGVLGAPVTAKGASYPDENAVSCPSRSRCWAAGESTAVSLDPAASRVGAAVSVPGMRYIAAIACGSAAECEVGGTAVAGTVQTAVVAAIVGGRPAKATAVPGLSGSSAVTAVACVAAASCLAAGTDAQGGFVARVSGRTVGPATPTGGLQIADLVCPSASACLGVGGYEDHPAVATVNPRTGAVGKPVVASAAGGAFTSVACVGLAACLGVGLRPGGGTWWARIRAGVPGAPHLVAGLASLAGVACPSRQRCLVAANSKALAGSVLVLAP